MKSKLTTAALVTMGVLALSVFTGCDEDGTCPRDEKQTQTSAQDSKKIPNYTQFIKPPTNQTAANAVSPQEDLTIIMDEQIVVLNAENDDQSIAEILGRVDG